MSSLLTIEGAVFALIGLLLAFTISGALLRFDERRQLVLQEANAVSTANDRLSLFEGQARDLQAKLRDYTAARIELYEMPRDLSLWEGTELWSPEQLIKIRESKKKLWEAAVAACPQSNYRSACTLALPALGNVFEFARLREGAAERHPPQIVYAMLFGFGLGGSLLAGFGMAAAPSRLHMLIFAAMLGITLYVVTDTEFPRLGVIRVDSFDHFLIDVYQQMQ
ncbi:hypothetical protein ACMDCR_13765 [Labrys okinawensis]|uniref:bestrophin-like domain n=1 Tax=Labrys okinawensis TaxID=346911 RepID=UPI0039BC517E